MGVIKTRRVRRESSKQVCSKLYISICNYTLVYAILVDKFQEAALENYKRIGGKNYNWS